MSHVSGPLAQGPLSPTVFPAAGWTEFGMIVAPTARGYPLRESVPRFD